MYVQAIEEISKFTRPIHTIARYYGNDFVTPWAASLFFVNNQGVALTCKHVAENWINQDNINTNYQNFKVEKVLLGNQIDAVYLSKLTELENKYNLKSQETSIQIQNRIMDSFDTISGFDCIIHPNLDLAIIKFKGFNRILYQSQAVFVANDTPIKQGKSLCRLGYPFVEFSNFEYNTSTDSIAFNELGNSSTPSFALDGMVTRNLADQSKNIWGVEMSTPGLKGQSGGPLFDTNGLVYGMQSATNHLHLGFDIKGREILSEGKKVTLNNQPHLHVGHCIEAGAIKDFLRMNQIDFQTASL